MQTRLDSESEALQAAIAGHYHLEAELGRGGMGVVYLAQDVLLQRLVAIKQLPRLRASDATLRERFLREARLAAGLSHPNIVPIFAVEEHDNLVFFVMAYVPGETLRAHVERLGPMDSAKAARLAQEVGWALAHAHAKGIVHRDVKPDNILIDRDSGRAMVTDFGIARALDAGSLTSAGEMLGTPLYVSPEQALGEPVDGRSDLYSLGATLFFALTGRPPFDNANVHAVLRMHMEDPAPPVGLLRPDVPKALAEVVGRCLAKTPASRFDNGESLADAVGAGGPIASGIPERIGGLREQIENVTGLCLGLSPAIIATIVFGMRGGAFDFMYFAFTTVILVAGILPGLSVLAGIRSMIRNGLGETELVTGLSLVKRSSAQHGAEERTHLLVPAFMAGVSWMLPFGLIRILDSSDYSVPLQLAMLAGLLALPVLATTVFFRALTRTGRGHAWWSRFLRSRLSRILVRIAGWRAHRSATPNPTAHEPTELILGDAARALFYALPESHRRSLADFPELIDRLEQAAKRLRAREAELADAIAGCGASGGARIASRIAEERARAAEDLERARRDTADRLATAVSALEGLRLDLLRLRAGILKPEAITADLDAARRISEDVDRTLAAVDQMNAAGGT